MAKRKRYDDDDGRVIAKMNVEGMPWYSGGELQTSTEEASEHEESGHTPYSSNGLTKKEEFWIFVGAMKAGFVVAGIFGIAMLIVILLVLI